MKREYWLSLLLVVAGIYSLPGDASAATIQQTVTIGSPSLFAQDGSCDSSGCSGTFEKERLVHATPFDSSLGDLMGVAIQLFHRQTITAELECTSLCPIGTSTAVVDVDLFLEDPEIVGFTDSLITFGQRETRTLSCADGCTQIYDFDLSGGIIIGEDLDRFQGPSTIQFRFLARDELRGSTSQNPPPLQIVDTTTLVTTYVYAPVPEPGTATLLAVGITMMGLRRK